MFRGVQFVIQQTYCTIFTKCNCTIITKLDCKATKMKKPQSHETNMEDYHNVEQKMPDLKEYIPHSFIYIKYKCRVEVRIMFILGRGEDSDRKRALGAFWGTGNILFLVYSADYMDMFSL